MAADAAHPDPERFRPFAYLATPNAELYRRVMLAFVAAKRRFVVHLRSEDVLAELAAEEPANPKAADDALAQLVEWGNLRADPDTSRVTSVEDFHRARFLYQLTHAGEAAERSLAVFDEQLGRRGALQAVALEDIATGLRALHELTREAEPDVARTGLLLRDLVRRCTDLAENAQAFMGSLQRTIDLYELDTDAFRAYKDRLIEYLERFVKDLTGTGGEIAELLGRLDPAGIDRLLALVARRDAEDAAPGVGGTVSAEDCRTQARAAELASWRERWLGLQQWFVSSPEHPSQAKLLRARARKAIPDLLAVVAMLNERRAGRSSATGRLLAAAGASREPVWLTLRQLIRSLPAWRDVDGVLIVENPSVVALAADTLGSGCPPIVCTNGQPRAAAMVLLRSLAAAGVRLRHHGDFDWAGLTIGNLLHRRLPVEPWRFDREAYLEAVAAHPHAAPLRGAPTSARWDPGLGVAMREAGRSIEEELVAAELLAGAQRFGARSRGSDH